MHRFGFSAPGTSPYAFIRILSSWHFSLCTHQDSQLLALVIMHRFGHCTGTIARLCSSSTAHIRSMIGFHLSLSAHRHPEASRRFWAPATPGTSRYAFIRLFSSWHLSLCIHQDSQLAYLVVVESYPHPGRLHLSEINHRGPLLTKWRADFPVTLRGARAYGSVCLTKGTVGAGGLMRKIPFSSLGLSILVFATFSSTSSTC